MGGWQHAVAAGVDVTVFEAECVADFVQEGGVGVAALGRHVVADVAEPDIAVAGEWAGVVGV